MKATKALPTEERVQRMNDHQWLWYYLNLAKDEEDDALREEKKWKARLDYLSWFINPKLAKSITDAERHGVITYSDENEEYVQGDEIVSSSFEEELKQAGFYDQSSTELPGSQQVGNPNESEDDFIKRVLEGQATEIPIGFESKDEYEKYQNGELIEQTNLKNLGINEDDIDYFEIPEDPKN